MKIKQIKLNKFILSASYTLLVSYSSLLLTISTTGCSSLHMGMKKMPVVDNTNSSNNGIMDSATTSTANGKEDLRRECCICMVNVANEELLCSHFFCSSCIDKHIDTQSRNNRSPTCPMCRADLVRFSRNEESIVLPGLQEVTQITQGVQQIIQGGQQIAHEMQQERQQRGQGGQQIVQGMQQVILGIQQETQVEQGIQQVTRIAQQLLQGVQQGVQEIPRREEAVQAIQSVQGILQIAQESQCNIM